ncbi:hypothetical protein ACWEQU_17680, partial [Streptomyces nodosus]
VPPRILVDMTVNEAAHREATVLVVEDEESIATAGFRIPERTFGPHTGEDPGGRHPSKDHLAPMSKAYRTTPQEEPSGEGEVRAD